MAPALLLATVLFAGFLVVLALIAYAAYRFSARREGPPLGFPGGCALTAVLLGTGFCALIAFLVVVTIAVVHHAKQSGELDKWRNEFHRGGSGSIEWNSDSDDEQNEAPVPSDPPVPPELKFAPRKTEGDVREY